MPDFSTPLVGPYGSNALDYAGRLGQYGANAVWFHGFNADAFERCAAHGLAACVEFPTFRADFSRHPELIPIGSDVNPIRYGDLVQGICLSQDAFVQEIEANLIAGLRTFAPTGIWLDYLTYAGWFETPSPDLQESCFCRACIDEFCAATGIDARTPAEILSRYRQEWTRHKCERIAGFALRYATLIRTHRPACIVGAYMCPWTPAEYDGALTRIFAQDYALLAPAIDVFTPLIYARKSGRPPIWAEEFLAAAPSFVPAGHPVQLILDALDFPGSMQSLAAAPNPGWGLQMFAGAEIFADPARAAVFAGLAGEMRAKFHA